MWGVVRVLTPDSKRRVGTRHYSWKTGWRETAGHGVRGCAALLGAIALATLVLLSLSSSALAIASPPGPPQSHYLVRLVRAIAYGPRSAERLDLCLPLGVRGPLPMVVAIHGGAWVGGTYAGFDGYCRDFAALGFAAASIGYRLAPRWVWPAQLEDAQLAVRYLRAHAAALDLNPRAVCAMGDSAGGHLALFLGSLTTIMPGDSAALYPDQSPQAQCVIDQFGPADLTRPMPLLDNAATLELLGGATRTSDPAVYREASPIFAISSHSAATLIIQGDRDVIVPPEQSRLMAAALRRAGAAVTYVSYPGGHEFGGLSRTAVRAIMGTEALWLLRWYSQFR